MTNTPTEATTPTVMAHLPLLLEARYLATPGSHGEATGAASAPPSLPFVGRWTEAAPAWVVQLAPWDDPWSVDGATAQLTAIVARASGLSAETGERAPPRPTSIVVLPYAVDPAAGTWRKLTGRHKVHIHKAVRCTALLASGCVDIAAGTSGDATDLTWGTLRAPD